MRLKRIEKFSRPVTKGLLPTQQAAISQVVCGMLFSRCLILAVIDLKAKDLGDTIRSAARKMRQNVISRLQLALHLLRESTKFLNLVFENKAGSFSLHWV